eukprot:7389098-Prymnesium_polylepis.1
MLRVALFFAAFGMVVNGMYGLQHKSFGFYKKSCDDFGVCPTADLDIMAMYVSPVMVGLPLLAMGISFIPAKTLPVPRLPEKKKLWGFLPIMV